MKQIAAFVIAMIFISALGKLKATCNIDLIKLFSEYKTIKTCFSTNY